MNKVFFIFFTTAFVITWAFHSYLFARLCQMFSVKIRVGIIASLFVTLIIFLSRYINNNIGGETLATLSRVIFYEAGWVFLILPWLLLLDLLLAGGRVAQTIIPNQFNIWHHYQSHRKQFGLGILLLSIALFSYSAWQFNRDIVINHFTIESDKVSRPYNILHISDLQLGSVGPEHVKKVANTMQQAIDKYNIDLIINTGDQVDANNYRDHELEPVAFTTPPTFFTLGNHEFYHGEKRITSLLADQGYTLLRGESSLFDELNLIGFDDNGNKQTVAHNLDEMDAVLNDKFNILLYHRPVGALDAKTAGIDLMLSGHTHGGQIFPYTLIVKYIFEFPQGLVTLDNFNLYTTDGIGLWGPQLRLGTQNEMAVFTISPTPQ